MSFDPLSRCPYFLFQEREHGIDKDASDEKGYDVPKMVTFILIVPHGHRGDPLEFFADEFIERKTIEAKSGRYDYSWVKEFKEGLAMFREGREIPRNGTPIITWERILKSRREQLRSRFPTIEDLASIPDSALSEIGLDGRVLRDMAKADIQAKKDLSPIVKELAEANETIRRQSEMLSNLEKRLAAVESNDDNSPQRGRPRKEVVHDN